MKISRRNLIVRTAALSAVSAIDFAAPGLLQGAMAANKKLLVGFAQPLANTAWRSAMGSVNKAYADKNYPNIEILFTDAQNQTTKQVSDVESLIARGIQILLISPMDQQALVPAVKEAMAAGIKVITLDRKVNTPVTCHLGADNTKIGHAAGERMVSILGGKGNIIEVMGGAGSSPAIERSKGFHEAIQGSPGIKVVAQQYCEWQRAPAMLFMQDMLQRFGPGQIQGVYCHADDSALGVVQVLKEAGRSSEIKVISIDGANLAFEAVAKGELAADFSYPFCAPEGIQAAYKVGMGEDVPKEIVLQGKGVFPENVKEFLGTGF